MNLDKEKVLSRRYIIFAPSYSEISGGSIVLHKLCALLNDLGYESYLYPLFNTFELNNVNSIYTCFRYIKSKLLFSLKKYEINMNFNTPIFKGGMSFITDDDIVIYPEITFGNPLQAKNVVRWLLHQPGFHTGNIYYGKGELYFKFNSAIDDFNYPNSITSEINLKIIHYPLEHYNMENTSFLREGTAYCLRKGKHKKNQHDLEDSILIDDKSHKEVSKIFKKIDTFISYDTYTAYSIFAVLCGCKSIVVPDDNITKEEWYPNDNDRNGIAYGFNNKEIEHATNTAKLVQSHIIEEEKKNINNIENFIIEVEQYFGK